MSSCTRARQTPTTCGMRLFGVGFTSAPRSKKPITVAHGRLRDDAFILESLELLPDWPSFEALLARPGPWLGGFGFPFGMPRKLVEDLDWPRHWPGLVRHCATLSRLQFRAVLESYRASRPLGRKYAHRSTDLPAPAAR